MRRYAILAVLALAGAVCGAQPLQWPVDHSRNPAMEVRDLPSELSEENLVWEFDVRGGSQFAMPVIAGDRLLLGSTQRSLLHDELARLNREQSGGALICLDRLTGDLEWELLAPGLGSIGSYGMYGICNTPLVESNRAYFVDPLGNLLCLDMNGQADGNDGPFTDELAYMANTGCHILKDRVLEDPPPAEMKSKYGDIIWRFEFLERFQLAWKHAFSGTMIIDGDLIYLPTSNSQTVLVKHEGKAVNIGYSRRGTPDGHAGGKERPNILVLDKNTGRLVAHDTAYVRRVDHGQWGTPSMGVVNGEKVLLFGDGWGIVHAFRALEPEDVRQDQVVELEEVWSFDCVPPENRAGGHGKLEYTHRHGRGDAPTSEEPMMANIMAAPCVADGRIYIAISRDHNYGISPGALWCLEPKGEGQLGKESVVWSSRDVQTGMATPAVADGLCYYNDSLGQLHCFDAATGEKLWQHRFPAGTYYCDPFVADGKVYLGSDRGHAVLEHGHTKKVLWEGRLSGAEPRTPVAVDGLLYVPTNRRLYLFARPEWQKAHPNLMNQGEIEALSQ